VKNNIQKMAAFKKMIPKCFLLFILLCAPSLLFAQEKTLDEKINDFVSPATNFISEIIFHPVTINEVPVPFILIWLFMGALFFTVYMGFINIRGFRQAIVITRGDYDNPKDKGEVTHFQALATALSGTVGLGNIAGVAVAISIGGPGATLWMILAGLLGMTTKFVECTLGVKYRLNNADGTVSGGPMYYLREGFSKKGFDDVGKVLAFVFAVMCIGGSLGGGNMFQGNQAAKQIIHITGGSESMLANNAALIGLGMAILVGFVIIGGMRTIAKVTDKIVPFMCGIYFIAAMIIIFYHFRNIPHCFALIFDGAVSGAAIKGGIIGVMIQGIKRAAFSNEAGVGSASIAHSAVKTKEPVSEGIVALLEPFIDTVVICTMTALVIVITGTYEIPGKSGVELTSIAFESVISWFPYVLSMVVFLFAFSTMISWSYYGLKAWTYIFGNTKVSDLSYKFIFCVFVVIGASMELGSVIDFSDAMIFAMSFPNMIAMYLLAPEVKRDLQSYMQRVKSGEIKKYRN
jgi:alanine or glycine:cation symporter, AGCS family